MYSANLTKIKKKISANHEGDEKQLEVIFSDSKRLVVEAPAGYGKTTTMISRIAYMFAADLIPNPKRILGLTFSVNAALKIKREVAAKLPPLIGTRNNPVLIGEKALVTNYHGFCKGILRKYGYLVSPLFRKDINLFRAVGDAEIEKQMPLRGVLSFDELQFLTSIETAVKAVRMPDAQDIHKYNEIIIYKLLPVGYITHNAEIMLVLEIFDKFEEVKKFYQQFFSLLVVDEFQDTNCIAWALLKALIQDNTQLLFLGDPLQRIYGFIGALPNIMAIAVAQYGMTKVVLSHNYRFRDNPEMLKLDRVIRENASTFFTPRFQSEDFANLPAFWGLSQQNEAEQIAIKVQNLITHGGSKVALLFRGRGKNAEQVEDELTKIGIPFFYGMFTDQDPEYIGFHNVCQEELIRRFERQKTVNRRTLLSFSNAVKQKFISEHGKAVISLLKLLDALIEKVCWRREFAARFCRE